MITYAEFILKYPNYSSISELLFNSWIPIAEARAAIFPIAYREIATELYLGELLCPLLPERSPHDVKKFTVQPEGYTVEYESADNGCNFWNMRLRELARQAGVRLRAIALSGNRTEQFLYPF